MDPNDLRAKVEQAIVAQIEPVAWKRCDIVNKAEQESLRTVLDAWKCACMTVHVRNIAHGTGDESLQALADVAQRAADLVRRQRLAKQEAVDRLYDAASAYGLVVLYGDDEIQLIFRRAFDDA